MGVSPNLPREDVKSTVMVRVGRVVATIFLKTSQVLVRRGNSLAIGKIRWSRTRRGRTGDALKRITPPRNKHTLIP